ncbi:MAG: cation transporter [Bacteroidota bacterium]|nr:cation transporter [Bacteroidota bacterium]
MKKILILSLAMAGFASMGMAQVKTVETAKIKTPNALCDACKMRIESYLRRYDGVVFIDVNYRKGITTVKWLTDRIDIEQIKTAISNVGYDADDVLANEDAYKRLPKTCKKFEDGGGHPKPKTPATPAQPGNP